ncbi:DUF4194 domain-containing protein [Halopseudomonas pachastrellae]|nr:DUF4194 domain-containing protein [Halopseudomonas pachastrellae]
MRDALDHHLNERGLSAEDFSELMIRLLDRGVLCRDESNREAELYDRYLQAAELVEDYLSVLRIRVLHEPRFNLVRVFPRARKCPAWSTPTTASAAACASASTSRKWR